MAKAGQSMGATAMRFVLRERFVISILVAAVASAILHGRWPSPEHNLALRLIQLKTPDVH